eukprot:TRINITY_DN6535_c0_g1_i5.p1 TRINITY_DN6535_c0_g1~~TRINITY_DN6535_c0_g1_i5.p1  ORF type:complete len:107 (+),score=7.59 TRINITY_DN6535_c0_g1_i5:65-385(+)
MCIRDRSLTMEKCFRYNYESSGLIYSAVMLMTPKIEPNLPKTILFSMAICTGCSTYSCCICGKLPRQMSPQTVRLKLLSQVALGVIVVDAEKNVILCDDALKSFSA